MLLEIQKTKPRFAAIDMLRGFAMLIMAVYHFCFDLNEVGVLHQNMNYSPYWLNYRALILTFFLSLAGIGLYLSRATYFSAAYWRRTGKIFLCALAISLGTYLIRPEEWVFFGVLHCILLGSLLAPLFIPWPRISAAIGAALILLPIFYRNIYLMSSGLLILGLAPIKPITMDFVPLCPWLGVLLIGIYLGKVISLKPYSWLEKSWRPLAKLGQYSLPFYMTHQFFLYPLAYLVWFACFKA